MAAAAMPDTEEHLSTIDRAACRLSLGEGVELEELNCGVPAEPGAKYMCFKAFLDGELLIGPHGSPITMEIPYEDWEGAGDGLLKLKGPPERAHKLAEYIRAVNPGKWLEGTPNTLIAEQVA